MFNVFLFYVLSNCVFSKNYPESQYYELIAYSAERRQTFSLINELKLFSSLIRDQLWL